MRRSLRLLGVSLCVPTLIASCGRAAESDPGGVAAEVPRDPWAPPPPDSLYGATASENLRVREVVLEARGIPRGWDGMRIVLLTDLLVGVWRDNAKVAQAAVRTTLESQPDLVVLAGNLIGDGGRASELREVLRPLSDRPTLAVLGVRDVRTDSLAAAVAAELRGSGITVLRNEVAGFSRGDEIGYVVGIEPVAGTSSPAGITEVLATVPDDAPTPLLISNVAEILTSVPEGRIPVALSGNVFCGEVELPGTPRFAALAEGPLASAQVPRVNRLFQARGTVLFIGCGTGYGFVPARWGSAPEVAIVTLHRIPDPQPSQPVEPAPP